MRFRALSYWLCFALVAVPAALRVVGLGYLAMGQQLWVPRALEPFYGFHSLIPEMARSFVPRSIYIALGYFMALLVLRRIRLAFHNRARVPDSYKGTVALIGRVGAFSVAVGCAALIVSMVLRAGSGVPAGLLFLPAMICVPWAFTLAEVLSFRNKGEAHA